MKRQASLTMMPMSMIPNNKIPVDRHRILVSCVAADVISAGYVFFYHVAECPADAGERRIEVIPEGIQQVVDGGPDFFRFITPGDSHI